MIYQWGQGLVLAFFWILYGLFCIFWWVPAQALYGYVLFHIVRAIVELLLCASSSYQGLMESHLKRESKLSPEERKQLYCLGQGIIIICGTYIITFVYR